MSVFVCYVNNVTTDFTSPSVIYVTFFLILFFYSNLN